MRLHKWKILLLVIKYKTYLENLKPSILSLYRTYGCLHIDEDVLYSGTCVETLSLLRTEKHVLFISLFPPPSSML